MTDLLKSFKHMKEIWAGAVDADESAGKPESVSNSVCQNCGHEIKPAESPSSRNKEITQ